MMTRPCDALPPVRGTYLRGASLKDLVWFRAGGPAEVLFRPSDADDLATFLYARSPETRVSVIGVGSNLLIRDGGVPGVVIRLPATFGKIAVEGARIRAGAAALDAAVSRAAADAGIGGLEFLRGIPGTVGGALRMNAGCYGREIKDIFVEATAIDGKGERHRLAAADMAFIYRKSQAPEDFIFVEAVFEGVKDDPAAVRARMDKLVEQREATQPVKTRTGGSTFKNPPGQKAWELIDRAGCRGMTLGGAQVSEKHCNFLINEGSATAADIEGLGEAVRARVREKFGVDLEWEIKRIGVPAGAEGSP
ncbi:MAG TPA: UDP-N-acetylmuramate dehydrogenase [Rhizomicrobium sp.]|jgi:UDP-N-acetylmuramate dehydrogenase|nr:UDP-N-acetylmuramate dehydrogenase [Rhizomicrobium sp.]